MNSHSFLTRILATLLLAFGLVGTISAQELWSGPSVMYEELSLDYLNDLPEGVSTFEVSSRFSFGLNSEIILLNDTKIDIGFYVAHLDFEQAYDSLSLVLGAPSTPSQTVLGVDYLSIPVSYSIPLNDGAVSIYVGLGLNTLIPLYEKEITTFLDDTVEETGLVLTDIPGAQFQAFSLVEFRWLASDDLDVVLAPRVGLGLNSIDGRNLGSNELAYGVSLCLQYSIYSF